jgi:antitoxin component YwqK of YwqJK toxin-antitoxin module
MIIKNNIIKYKTYDIDDEIYNNHEVSIKYIKIKIEICIIPNHINQIKKIYYCDNNINKTIYYNKYKSLDTSYFSINNKYIGNYICYSRDKPIDVDFYIDNNVEGLSISYHQNGCLSRKSYYISGCRNGDYITYYESGNIEQKRYYINNIVKTDILYDENENIKDTYNL